MEIRIVEFEISLSEINKMAKKQFGNLIKATVDIQKKIMAVGGELHADEEQILLEKGSKQADLWGINLYPQKFGKSDFVEYDSMINLRPSQNNMSRGVEDPAVRKQIQEIVANLVKGEN